MRETGWRAGWGRRAAAGLVLAMGLGLAAEAGAQTAPVPSSDAVTGVSFDWSSYRRLADGSDNWPTTWARDGAVYSSWGDGGGFGQGANQRAYVYLGIARLRGASAATISGENLIGGLNATVAPCFKPFAGAALERQPSTPRRNTPCFGRGLAGKSRSLLARGGYLYAMVTPNRGGDLYREARIYKAPLGTNNWQRAPWAFDGDDGLRLVAPSFLQAGRDGADGDGWTYAYAVRYAPERSSALSLQKSGDAGTVVLLRAAANADLLNRGAWSVFAGADGGPARWSANFADAQPVLRDENGVGWATSAIYIAPLRRYFLLNQHSAVFRSKLSILESTQPYGPWRSVFYDELGGPGAPSGFFYNIVPSTVSADGTRFTLAYTGLGALDSLNLVDARFDLGGAP